MRESRFGEKLPLRSLAAWYDGLPSASSDCAVDNAPLLLISRRAKDSVQAKLTIAAAALLQLLEGSAAGALESLVPMVLGYVANHRMASMSSLFALSLKGV